jgi:predicted ATPase
MSKRLKLISVAQRDALEVRVDRGENIGVWITLGHTPPHPQPHPRLIGTHTPVLSNDGSDLAAALQTIIEIGDPASLAASIDDAFSGATISVLINEGRFEVEMRQHGLLRGLKAAELSDGTLRDLLWVAALHTPRPPGLLVLNEPETSLHPDLPPPLGRLIARPNRE